MKSTPLKPWEKTYQKCRVDLESEAADHNGIISKDALEHIISINVGKDRRRTIPDAIEQLKGAFVIKPCNRSSFYFMKDGWADKFKQLDEERERKHAEQILGARA